MLLIIIFNFVPSINTHSSYFHSQNKTKIKLADYETLQQEWLATQPKMKRYDIPVLSKEIIPEILKYFNIETSTYGLDKSTYNPYAKNIFYWKLKNPPAGLLGVYFKARKNPFKIKYPKDDDEYTLDDLLKYEIAIEEAFVFWDIQQKTQEEKDNMELIFINHFVDQSKEEAIKNYLIQHKTNQEPKLIKLGCYNITPTTGLIAPLPLGGLGGIEIEAIYFDDGIRLLPENQKTRSLKGIIKFREELIKDYQTELNQTEDERRKKLLTKQIVSLQEEIKELYQEIIKQQTYTIEDLLKLSNGAKNIYLFSFNTQKRIKSIELPDAIDPYQAIRDWKRDNNLFDYEGEFILKTFIVNDPLILPPPFNKEINLSCKINQLENIFKTEKKKFLISCQDVEPKKDFFQIYKSKYVDWLNQCYIKPGISYSAKEIRNKFGRSSRDIYNEEGKKCRYYYVTNTFIDDWYVNGIECSGSNNTFSNFYDTTPPPKKPQELNIN